MGVERRGRRGGAGGAFASGLHLPVHLVNWASVPRSGCVQIDQLQRFCTQTWHLRARHLSTCLWGVSLETWGAPGTRVFSFFLSFFFFCQRSRFGDSRLRPFSAGIPATLAVLGAGPAGLSLTSCAVRPRSHRPLRF